MTAAAMGGFVSILPHCLPVIGSVQQKRAAQVQTWQQVLEETIDAWAKIFSPYDGCPKTPRPGCTRRAGTCHKQPRIE